MKTRDVEILLIKMQERLATLKKAEDSKQTKEQKHSYTLRISELNLAISAVEAILELHKDKDKKKEKKAIKKLAKHGLKKRKSKDDNKN